jgi:hypothetical protein
MAQVQLQQQQQQSARGPLAGFAYGLPHQNVLALASAEGRGPFAFDAPLHLTEEAEHAFCTLTLQTPPTQTPPRVPRRLLAPSAAPQNAAGSRCAKFILLIGCCPVITANVHWSHLLSVIVVCCRPTVPVAASQHHVQAATLPQQQRSASPAACLGPDDEDNFYDIDIEALELHAQQHGRGDHQQVHHSGGCFNPMPSMPPCAYMNALSARQPPSIANDQSPPLQQPYHQTLPKHQGQFVHQPQQQPMQQQLLPGRDGAAMARELREMQGRWEELAMQLVMASGEEAEALKAEVLQLKAQKDALQAKITAAPAQLPAKRAVAGAGLPPTKQQQFQQESYQQPQYNNVQQLTVQPPHPFAGGAAGQPYPYPSHSTALASNHTGPSFAMPAFQAAGPPPTYTNAQPPQHGGGSRNVGGFVDGGMQQERPALWEHDNRLVQNAKADRQDATNEEQ